jgi:hypothetical protein
MKLTTITTTIPHNTTPHHTRHVVDLAAASLCPPPSSLDSRASSLANNAVAVQSAGSPLSPSLGVVPFAFHPQPAPQPLPFIFAVPCPAPGTYVRDLCDSSPPIPRMSSMLRRPRVQPH